MKTNRAAAKRFRFTSTGKVKRNQAFKNHILTKKNSNRKRDLRHGAMIHVADMNEVKALMPYG